MTKLIKHIMFKLIFMEQKSKFLLKSCTLKFMTETKK